MQQRTTTMELDTYDLNAITAFVKMIEDAQNIKVRTVTFDAYGQHRITASRRGQWSPLRVRKIMRLLPR